MMLIPFDIDPPEPPPLDREELLQGLIARARIMIDSMTDDEVQMMAKTAYVLMDQWQNWYTRIRRLRAR